MAQIRAGFAAALASLKSSWSVQPYMISAAIAPFIAVVGATIDFDVAMQRGADRMMWTICACVPATTDVGSQTLLEELIDPTSATSLKTLLEADRTLGGVISWLRVLSVKPPALYSHQGQPEALGVEFVVEVMT